MNEGKKFDSSKRKWNLLQMELLEEVVDVLEHGAEKYGESNWQKLDMPFTRYYNAAMRHLTSWQKGEIYDEESGYSHLSHCMCCLLFLLWHQQNIADHEFFNSIACRISNN